MSDDIVRRAKFFIGDENGDWAVEIALDPGGAAAAMEGLVAEIERLTKHRDTLSAMIDRLSTYLDGVGLNSWTNGACWAAERAVRDLKAEIDRLQADNDRLRDETDWTLFDMAVNAAARAHVEELQEKVRLRDAALQRVRDLIDPKSSVVSVARLLAALDGEQLPEKFSGVAPTALGVVGEDGMYVTGDFRALDGESDG